MSDKSHVTKEWLEKYPRAFPKACKTVGPVPGAIAVSRAGRDRYRTFIITEVLPARVNEKNLRVTVTDGKLRPTSSPTKKNLSHLILVGMSDRAAELLELGKLTDKDAAEIIEEFRSKQIS